MSSTVETSREKPRLRDIDVRRASILYEDFTTLMESRTQISELHESGICNLPSETKSQRMSRHEMNLQIVDIYVAANEVTSVRIALQAYIRSHHKPVPTRDYGSKAEFLPPLTSK